MSNLIQTNSWDFLKQYTDARIALGRSGHSLPTQELLKFQLAHAQAKDAVLSELKVENLKLKFDTNNWQSILFKSQVKNRNEYLKRPDLGKKLSIESRNSITKLSTFNFQLSIVVVDGLSAQAIETNAIPFLELFIPLLQESQIEIAPITIVEQGRVAIGDEIGELLSAQIVVVLIGERPGLSSPNSMGIYMTYHPKVGLTDESRNCISNIRPKGLTYKEAALKLLYLITRSRELKFSGVNLKDELLLNT